MNELNNKGELLHESCSRYDKWYAVRVSYSRELTLKAILDKEKIENFIPMRYGYIIKTVNVYAS